MLRAVPQAEGRERWRTLEGRAGVWGLLPKRGQGERRCGGQELARLGSPVPAAGAEAAGVRVPWLNSGA